MPTYHRLPRFKKDYAALDPSQKAAFREAVAKFVADLAQGGRPRKGLRVKGVQGAPGIFEMSWADDGRATFQFGPSVKEGEPHIIWRRVGTHDVFEHP